MIEWLSKIYGYLKKALGNIKEKISELYEWGKEHFDYQAIFNEVWEFVLDMAYKLGDLSIQAAADLVNKAAEELPTLNIPTMAGTFPTMFIETFNWIFPTQYAITLVGFFLAAIVMWIISGWFLRKLSIFG